MNRHFRRAASAFLIPWLFAAAHGSAFAQSSEECSHAYTNGLSQCKKSTPVGSDAREACKERVKAETRQCYSQAHAAAPAGGGSGLPAPPQKATPAGNTTSPGGSPQPHQAKPDKLGGGGGATGPSNPALPPTQDVLECTTGATVCAGQCAVSTTFGSIIGGGDRKAALAECRKTCETERQQCQSQAKATAPAGGGSGLPAPAAPQIAPAGNTISPSGSPQPHQSKPDKLGGGGGATGPSNPALPPTQDVVECSNAAAVCAGQCHVSSTFGSIIGGGDRKAALAECRKTCETERQQCQGQAKAPAPAGGG